jgi:serine/threonine-protein phosphatase 5
MAALVEASEDEVRALELKTQGNDFIKECKYGLAAQKYTEAIKICPSAVLYSNRAQAYIKMESYGVAIQDADQAIE